MERAGKNLASAGLVEWVEFRIGDARETLANPPSNIDMIFLDGAKELFLSVLKILEPQLRAGGIVASDNTDHEGMETFLRHVRHCIQRLYFLGDFYERSRGKAHEISIAA